MKNLTILSFQMLVFWFMIKRKLTNMKKIFLMLAIVLCIAIECIAEPVSYSSARQIATTFLQSKGATVNDDDATPNAPNAKGRQATAESSPYYVFNATAEQGFVIVSGDDCVGDNLVLGYADRGSFDAKSVPANMQWWLGNTASQITALSQCGVKATSVPLHDDIPYLIKTVWDQGKDVYTPENPFNAFCPQIDGKLCFTGCMATALAQVMYYHRCPQGPIVGDVPAYDSYGGRIVDALPATSFDWDNMAEDYRQPTTKEQQDAVAKLMRYCGQVSRMMYGLTSSSSVYHDVDMLITQFGYDSGMHLEYASDYTVSGWDNLIYNELKEGRPLLYNGFSDGAGHAFILDGYAVQDGSGYFHVNWGWSGSYDGYFKLNMLNPNSSDYYNNHQYAYIGVQPAVGPISNYGRYLCEYTWDPLKNETSCFIEAVNISNNPGIFEIALAELNEDGTADCSRLFGLQKVNAEGYNNESLLNKELAVTITLPEGIAEGMTPGSHKMALVNREAETGADWRPLFGPTCIIELIIGDDGKLKETIYHPVQQLTASAENFEIEGLRQRGYQMTWPVTLINKNDEDYIGSVCCDVYEVKDNVLQDCVGSHFTGIMLEGKGTADAIFNISVDNPGDYILLVNLNAPLVTGISLDDIKNSKGYIMHQAVTIGTLDFFCQKLSYSERNDEHNEPACYLDAVMENKTTMDYGASLLARIYKLNDEDDYDLMFPGFSRIHNTMPLQANTSTDVSIKLPGQLEAGEYKIDLCISNTFQPTAADGYFVLTTMPLTIPEPTAVAEVKAAAVSASADGKYIKDGRLIIVRDGKEYTVSGAQMK